VLPGTSGPAFVQRAELEGVPVIFMSGYSALHVERRAAGRCLLLEKPFTKRDLLRAVQDLHPS
jgi:FixJ family two-component response regulator